MTPENGPSREGREHLKVIDGGQEPSQYQDNEMLMRRDMRGQLQAKLYDTPDAWANVVPLKGRSYIDSEATKLSKLADAEQAKAHDVEAHLDDPEHAELEIKQQLEYTHVHSEIIATFALLLRRFGANDVYLVENIDSAGDEGKGPGFDAAKLGHIQDFEKATTFVIPKSREADIRQLATKTINIAPGQSEHFNLNLRFQYLDDKGFSLVYGEKEPYNTILFLYGENKNKRAGSGEDESAQPEDHENNPQDSNGVGQDEKEPKQAQN
ncbi:MAG TPA: hypothetical protein DCS29_00705 [Candidatus Magasanikbacteria bacterium]|nr:MAG: hypothetical protein A2479_04435 [Candidatus Magasanikbacteria bacterium RIFOXYC2_FULL_39_8]HAT03286.1 hypothetical protein [Candidatus Magasanikbacteria bacterium]